MKKEYWQLLLIYAFIGIVAAGFTGWFLYQYRLEYWQTQARDAFRSALQEETQKWKGIPMYLHLSGGFRLPDDSTDIKKEPIKLLLTSEYGQKEFWVPYEKHARNMERSRDTRGAHSYLLHVSPLSADSLNLFWKNRLAAMGFPGTTAVRISVSDWQEHESYTYSEDSLYLSESDSLFTYYLGLRCEVGMTGYLYHSWWMVLSRKDKVLLAVLVASCILLFFIQEYVSKVYHRLFVKEKHIVVEKEVPVVAGHGNPSHIYQLEAGVYFDAASRLLKRGDDVVNLPPLLARLLQGFLDAEDNRLSNDEILHLLWPDGSGSSNKMYQNIRRLRDCLSLVSCCIIERGNFTYQLKIPYFIEGNAGE